MNFGEIAEFGSELDERIDDRRSRASVCSGVGRAEAAGIAHSVTAAAAALVSVVADGCDEFNRLLIAFQFGTPMSEVAPRSGAMLRRKNEREGHPPVLFASVTNGATYSCKSQKSARNLKEVD